MKKIIFSKKDTDRILELRRQKISLKLIGQMMGVCDKTIASHLKESGLDESVKKKAKHLTEEEIERMKKMRSDGATYKEIAQKFYVCENTVAKHLRDIKQKPKWAKVSKEDIDEMIELKEKGLSSKKIGRKFGVPSRCVGYHIKKRKNENLDNSYHIPYKSREEIGKEKNRIKLQSLEKKVGDIYGGGKIVKVYPTYYLIKMKNYMTTMHKINTDTAKERKKQEGFTRG